MGIIPNFYSPISDETKYYFYMCVDFMRRKSINNNQPLMKSQIIDIIKKLGELNGMVLNKEVFQNKFPFLDVDFFENDYTIFIQNSRAFSFTLESYDSNRVYCEENVYVLPITSTVLETEGRIEVTA